ncbi:L-xylulose reductase [Pseudolycoriella hygida]|uniref:L-xylulose reductase n=1 Tax=Pseudolycoriella hygida TaxID=35572 RepID=A0A9Q0NF37_9DIPT|nr:L-xylulose reductase [Pseudolycoriella hygida]
MNRMSLTISFIGKNILITGGGQGIGRQLVQRFYDGGATVFTLDKNPETIERLRNELPNIRAAIVDLSDWDATRKVVESFGGIDYLINSAGVIITEDLLSIKKESAALQVNVNLLAAVNVTQCVAKSMVRRGTGGAILNISSGAAKRVGVQTAIYSATKAAIENLTKTMAVELAPHNIRVNCICPGGVDTPMLTSVPAQKYECLKRHLISRLVDPNEIAELAIFLLSSSASMITGETVVIDGGYTIT